MGIAGKGICLELWATVTNSAPQVDTSVKEEFKVFLRTENLILFERWRERISLSRQKIQWLCSCTWKGRMSSSLLMEVAFGITFFYSPGICTKQQVVRFFRRQNPNIFHLTCWTKAANQLRTEDTESDVVVQKVTPVGVRKISETLIYSSQLLTCIQKLFRKKGWEP